MCVMCCCPEVSHSVWGWEHTGSFWGVEEQEDPGLPVQKSYPWNAVQQIRDCKGTAAEMGTPLHHVLGKPPVSWIQTPA